MNYSSVISRDTYPSDWFVWCLFNPTLDVTSQKSFILLNLVDIIYRVGACCPPRAQSVPAVSIRVLGRATVNPLLPQLTPILKHTVTTIIA